jgi:choline dehydrogenase-like flavoprotein
MRLDSSSLEPGATLCADIAIVGAGPAGIVIATELARHGHRILLIESGGHTPDAEIQRLGDTESPDPLHVPMSLSTSRRVGGASNLWGGRCVPFDPIDFERRDIVGESAWPVRYEDISPYFLRACEWCICGEPRFNAHDVPLLTGNSLIPGFPDGEVCASSLERWSLPTNFAREYGRAIDRDAAITLVTRLTCTEVVCDESGLRVAHLRAQSLDGKPVTITAGRYVLACGGLETTRLLLASNRHHSHGLGNHSGHLGRWYMAHVESRIARVHFRTAPTQTIYGHEQDADGVYVRRRLTFSPEFQTARQIPNTAMWLVNPEISDPAHGSGVLSFAYLMLASPLGRWFVAEGIRQAHVKRDARVSIRAHLANVVSNLGPAARFAVTFGYQRYLKRGRKVPGFFVRSNSNVYPLLYHGEHLPQRESRVSLTTTRDRVGMPRLQTHLLFGDDDIAGVIRAHQYLDEYLREHALGHLEYLYDDCEAAVREQLFGGYHQAGTTRMSTLPKDGVVDRHLGVHGFDDLFISSSSAFVTSGQANSTFMIVAFALRLADHLHQQPPSDRAIPKRHAPST